MKLISRHASVLALLSCLFAALAAPYLVAADPDSSVFRSGTLSVLLVFAAFFPLKSALRKVGKRTFICGLVFGFLLSLSLSLGSELTFYNGFSDGAYSMLRRILIPVIAAPFLGTLAAKCMEFSLKRRGRETPLLLWSSLIFVCWIPVLLAHWPGMINYDFEQEIIQREWGYYLIHPLLYSFLQNAILSLGEQLGSLSYGLLLLNLFQMVIFSLMLGRLCQYTVRRAGMGFGILLLVFFGFHPVFSVLSCSRSKDPYFASALLILSLDILELLSGEKKVTPVLTFRFIICIVTIIGTRNNGAVVLLALPFFILAMRPHRTAFFLSLAGCAAALCVQMFLTYMLSPAKGGYYELINVPIQQLVRANAEGTLTEEESAELRTWFDDEIGLGVYPHFADWSKTSVIRSRINNEFKSFISLWLRCAPHSLKPYAEAFLMLNIGSWYPDDVSHSMVYRDANWADLGYLETHELNTEGFQTTCYIPFIRDLINRICYKNEYQKYPLIPLLFAPAVYFFMLVFAALLLIAKGKKRLLPAMLGVFFLWIIYLLGPCTLARYMLPLFCMAPVMLITAFSQESTPADDRLVKETL